MLNDVTEVWKPVKSFENVYKVSNLGRISNHRKILATHKINSGYMKVSFKFNGHLTNKLVHRVVAEAFIPNSQNKKEVNHLDGNRLNNRSSNLEWVTSSENKRHAREQLGTTYNVPTLGIKKGKGSKYYNVCFDKARGKWKACVRVNKVNHFQQRFDTEEEAALHVNWILDELNLYDRPRNVIV